MKLFYGLCSGNSARALFGLLESGVPFEHRPLDTRLDENRTAEYLSVNPTGKIPALLDGDFALWESNAINLYAAEKSPASLVPQSPQQRASMHRWIFFQTAHVSPASIPVFRFTNARVQRFWKTQGDAKAAEAAQKELARFLPVLDSALRDRDWLEKTFSLADVAYAPHLFLLDEAGFDFSPYPHLSAWLARLIARPAWKETAERVFNLV